jgi:hypothetical protein
MKTFRSKQFGVIGTSIVVTKHAIVITDPRGGVAEITCNDVKELTEISDTLGEAKDLFEHLWNDEFLKMYDKGGNRL